MTLTLAPPEPPACPTPPPRRPGPSRRWVAILVVPLLVPVVSYVRALTYPGHASVLVRTVEWVRDNGGGGLVDLAETWWYSRAPTASAPDPASVPHADTTAGSAIPSPITVPAGLTPLPGEGRWSVRRSGAGVVPVLATTFVRPDPRHPGVMAGVARIDTRATRLRLVSGTAQPDRSTSTARAQVPAADRAALVATFNSGFTMSDARGGFLADGRSVVPLRVGAASVVIHRDGRATVGEWGRDAFPTPEVVAVRQNLDLVVDGGRVVDGLVGNLDARWGSPKNQLQYTWRSGLGVDAAGALVYVAGPQMDLAAMAEALLQAGAVRGMQLDIHNEMVDFFSYPPGGATPAAGGTRLLPGMPGGTARYLVPDQRDFFTVTLR